MKKHTLILNADGSPMNLLPIKAKDWQGAIKTIYEDGAQVLHVYEDWIVRSPRAQFHVPAVLVNTTYKKYKRHVSFSKHNLCLRDRFTCQYCREVFPETKLTMDHVQPRSHGGPKNWANISAACGPCNLARATNTKIRPMREPYVPSYYEMVEKAQQYPIYVPHESWGYYLGWKPELINVVER